MELLDNDIFIVYSSKEYVNEDTCTFMLEKRIPADDFIIFENLNDGISISADEYKDVVIYSLEEELEDKIKNYAKQYDAIHLRFFNIDLDDIKNKYSKIINESNTKLIIFEEDKELYDTTIVLNSNDLEELDEDSWFEKKDYLINKINEVVEKNEKVDFNADYSFSVRKTQKKIDIEFDTCRALYRIKIPNECDSVLEASEVEDMIDILDFCRNKSRS